MMSTWRPTGQEGEKMSKEKTTLAADGDSQKSKCSNKN
jgi:hypothetical protein